MCGIAAIIPENRELQFQDRERLFLMLSCLKHRGDTFGEVEFGTKFAIGTNRLKIVDREGGKQPISNETGNILVVFNGEIYNYRSLQLNLKKKGHHFRTECDTEVLVHLYEDLGDKLVHELDGMFAFVIYDKAAGKFLAGRDPYGIKPLYISNDKGCFYFASEIKALSKLGLSRVDDVLPGHVIINGFHMSYYSYKREDVPSNLEDCARILRNRIENAVEKRVQTDLPVGVLFGGGIDSTIVLLLALKFHSNVTAFTIGKPDSEDFLYAERFYSDFEVQHRSVSYQLQDIERIMPQLIYQVEGFEPNLIRGSVLSYLLSKLVAENGIKVALCGEGSDEIFAGYRDFTMYDGVQNIQSEIERFLFDLFRTQLQRVDRCSMAHRVEVRVPFLDRKVVEFAVSVPAKFKVINHDNNVWITKYILREAFKDILPDYIYKREKITLMQGAGLGKVSMENGFLREKAEFFISSEEFRDIQKLYHQYSLQTKEDVYYFKEFFRHFANYPSASKRPKTAKFEFDSTIPPA